MSKTEQERGREELVRGLSVHFIELRRRAGMTQQGVADAMGKALAGRKLAGRLERGAVANASLLTVAEYLRAVRAGFGDLKDVLDRYTSIPIPEPARKLAEAAPPPRVQTGARTWENGDSPSERADARYSPRFPERREPGSRTPKEEPDIQMLRVRRRAGYWVLRRVFEHFLHSELNAIGISPASWFRRRTAQYGRKVFNALFRTRGPKEVKRQERMARLRVWAEKHQLVAHIPEYMEFAVGLVFEDMAAHDELDWMPPPAEAYAIMAVKPKRRVVTDVDMCLAEWWEAYRPYALAIHEVYERVHKAATDVATSARCDARTMVRYKQAAMRAANIARTTAPDTPRRRQSVVDFHATDWPPEMNRRLLARVLAAAIEVWDALLPTLPPPPGPMPV